MKRRRPTPEELYEAKYTLYSLEAINGGPPQRVLGKSRRVWATILALAGLYLLWRLYG